MKKDKDASSDRGDENRYSLWPADHERQVQRVNPENLADILTVPEIASFLKLSKVMVYKLVETGRMPHYRIGRAVRISRDQFLRWLEGQNSAS